MFIIADRINGMFKDVNEAIQNRDAAVIQSLAKQLLAGTATATSYTPTAATVTVGDFTGTIANAAGVITVTATAGPTWFATSTATKSKSFKLY